MLTFPDPDTAIRVMEALAASVASCVADPSAMQLMSSNPGIKKALELVLWQAASSGQEATSGKWMQAAEHALSTLLVMAALPEAALSLVLSTDAPVITDHTGLLAALTDLALDCKLEAPTAAGGAATGGESEAATYARVQCMACGLLALLAGNVTIRRSVGAVLARRVCFVGEHIKYFA